MLFLVSWVLLSTLQEDSNELELRTVHGPFSLGPGSVPSWMSSEGPPTLLYTSVSGKQAMGLEWSWEVDSTSSTVHSISGMQLLLNWADFPASAGLEDGTQLIAWLVSEPAHAHSYGTRFMLVPPGATTLSESVSKARPLEEHRGPGEHGFVSLAPLDESRFLALWLDGRAAGEHGAGDTRVYARTIDRAGALGPELVVDPRACSCCPTSMVRLADGTHLAAWRDRSDAEVRDVALGRFDGARWSEPELLHADGWKIDGCPVNGPRLAASAARVAAAWYTGADGSVRASFADAGGRRFGAPIRVDDGSPEGRGDLAFLPDGSLLVGWMEHEPARSSWRVRRVSPDGTLGPALVVAHVSSERASGFLRMTSDAEGVLLAYTETEPERRVAVRRVTQRSASASSGPPR